MTRALLLEGFVGSTPLASPRDTTELRAERSKDPEPDRHTSPFASHLGSACSSDHPVIIVSCLLLVTVLTLTNQRISNVSLSVDGPRRSARLDASRSARMCSRWPPESVEETAGVVLFQGSGNSVGLSHDCA
ncbi:hypothetical protein THAOC_33330 [Thalassiosira oceanica]|uniref:Uncharacterized protein n=1 Tax=Thalassiosira oceanica TaxID=159749 RepID=K0RG03_THAOC|nr:hypothetical protein THAOC_33330 [Thalassiosira oceanica]|eukprot:EJK47916.1 hypothetical protein THAOC_33330 [Thalassiosira oceanica]